MSKIGASVLFCCSLISYLTVSTWTLCISKPGLFLKMEIPTAATGTDAEKDPVPAVILTTGMVVDPVLTASCAMLKVQVLGKAAELSTHGEHHT